jgi:hypothetical protein
MNLIMHITACKKSYLNDRRNKMAVKIHNSASTTKIVDFTKNTLYLQWINLR